MKHTLFKTASLVSLFALAACNSAPTTVTPDGGASDIPGIDDTGSIDATTGLDSSAASSDAAGDSISSSAGSAASAAATDDTVAPQARIIEMSVDDWTFSPSTITVQKGENVVIRLHGVEGKHSFAIAELGLNVAVDPGTTKDVTLPTNTAGTFTFRCRVPCGPGHMDMNGTLTIVG